MRIKRSLRITTNTMSILVIFISICSIYSPLLISATQDEANGKERSIFDYSLAELLNVEIELASKKKESLLDSPLSSSVLTRQDIIESGATSIMEALRLVPGIIVREQTPGNYDIHIRGFDNIPGRLPLTFATNSLTLVMIDNRIIYNYFNGGTFWEGLPIDINDIDRIEVIRGASSALYGPNAVTGVINIITRQPEKRGIVNTLNAQGGSYNSWITNGSVGYSTGKFSALFSGNYMHRHRMQTTFYDHTQKAYLDYTAFNVPQRDILFGEPPLAIKKYGINGFFDYRFNSDTNLRISTGYQDARARKSFFDLLFTPLAIHSHETGYINAELNIHRLAAKISYYKGDIYQEGDVNDDLSFDMKNFHANVEYKIEGQNFHIRPGIAYSRAHYFGNFLGGEGTMETFALSFLGEWSPTSRIRLIAGLRGDKYNRRDNIVLSFQLAATYKLNKNNLLRAVYSKAHQSPFMIYTSMKYGSVEEGLFREGNPNIKPVTIHSYELGYRTKINDRLHASLEMTYSVLKNLPASIGAFETLNGMTYFHAVYTNLPTVARQKVMTLSINYSLSPRCKVKLFGTLQKTNIIDAVPNTREWDVTTDITHQYTPDFYGGIRLSYRPARKIKINGNIYFYTDQVFNGKVFRRLEISAPYNEDVPIDGKTIFNLKASYEIIDGLSLFVTARNLFSSDSNEFPYTDRIKRVVFAGFNYEFN